MKKTFLVLMLVCATALLGAQVTGTGVQSNATEPQVPLNPNQPGQVQGPSAPTVPGTTTGTGLSTPAGTTLPVSPAVQSGNASPAGRFTGTWVVERAVYDFLMVMRDVSATDGNYYARITFGANGQGTVQYRGKQTLDPMEFEFREQGLTIAYGSRLRPNTDLFQVLEMNDGTVFLKSRRLGTMNGTMLYLLRREQ